MNYMFQKVNNNKHNNTSAYGQYHYPVPLYAITYGEVVLWYYVNFFRIYSFIDLYRGADKSLARPTSPMYFFYGENISFDASLVIYINSTNIHPNMIIKRIYEHQNLLSL